jgi:hypothetical protein
MAANFSDEHKIEVIEHFIEQWRPARNSTAGDRDVYLILKEIAADIRGRGPNVPGRARDRLQRAINEANFSKTSGYATPPLRRIAETVISEWPTIRQALNEFEGKTK